jgi:hypothetical protein
VTTTKNWQKRWDDLQKRKDKQIYEDGYLLDDPGGHLTRLSDQNWNKLLSEENALLREKAGIT